MAALIETYAYDWMRAIPGGYGTLTVTGQGIVWNLVHQLTGQLQGGTVPGAWTVEGSSDGTTADFTGGNRWWNGGTFSAALMPWDASGARGWIVLKSPPELAPQTWLMIALHGSVAVPVTCLIYASFSAFSGGSTTTRPTSATEFVLSNNANYAAGGWGIVNGAAGNHATHLSLASDGAFFWGANRGGVSFRLGLMVNKLLDPPTIDAYPVVTWKCHHSEGMQLGYNTASPPAADAYSPGSYISAYATNFWEQDGAALINAYQDTFALYTRNFNNSITVSMRPIFPYLRYTGGTNGRAAFPNIYSGALDGIRQQYPEWQVWLTPTSAGANGYGVKGRVRDLHTAFGLSELVCEPSGTDPITRVVWGSFWVPGNQVLSF